MIVCLATFYENLPFDNDIIGYGTRLDCSSEFFVDTLTFLNIVICIISNNNILYTIFTDLRKSTKTVQLLCMILSDG